MFTGFPAQTIPFFMDLCFHNSTTWFHEHHDEYQAYVQAPFYALIEDMIPIMQRIEPQVEIRPHKLLSRIHRDTRFSKDKSPYRDHAWIWFKRGGEERWMSIGFWFEFGVDHLSWGMASWGENRLLMDRFRRELAARPSSLDAVIRSCELPSRHLVLSGSRFKRLEIPPGLPDSLIPWYTLRDFAITQAAPSPELAVSSALPAKLAANYLAMAPIYHLLRGMQDSLENETKTQAQQKKLLEGEF